jgi:CspA family cold shock protein
MSLTGTVKNFMVDKGFGFISPDDGGEEIFIHIQQCNGAESLSEGDKVTFDKAWNGIRCPAASQPSRQRPAVPGLRSPAVNVVVQSRKGKCPAPATPSFMTADLMLKCITEDVMPLAELLKLEMAIGLHIDDRLASDPV